MATEGGGGTRAYFAVALLVILLGVGNTVLHVLAVQLLYAAVNGAASLVGLWAFLTIFLDRH